MNKKTVEIVLTVVFALAVVGCRERRTTLAGPAARATQDSAEQDRRYDDPQCSPDQRKAIRAATEAVLDPKRPRPDFDQAFRYHVSQNKDGWFIIVWHVYGFKDGNPQFVPGGFTGVQLDRDFKLMHLIPGE